MEDVYKELAKLDPKTTLELTKNEEGTYYIDILDAEGDSFRIDFNYDDCATVSTDGIAYAAFTKKNLETMLNLIDITNCLYEDE